MFGIKTSREARKRIKNRKQVVYDRVYELHKQAEFLCYINDVYPEEYKGKAYVKLEGLVAFGVGATDDHFLLFDCEGREKAEVDMEELYVGNNLVEQLEGGDKRVALYPIQQDVPYKAGDILCKMKGEK